MTVATVEAANAALIAAQNKAASSTVGTSSTSTGAQTQLSSDVNFFLKMLTTQLKNQDPTAPMDTAQFTAQIAQYSGVQQQVQTNANLEKLLAASKQSSTTTAVGYIGKEIETAGKTGLVVGGQGAFTYILPKAAKEVQVKITNAAGATVFQGLGAVQQGRNTVVWDGKNSSTGAQEADGVYNLTVTAVAEDNTAILPETRAVAIVSGVETDKDGNVMLTVGQTTVNYNDVLAVRSPSRIATPSTTDTSTTDTTSGASS
ncbi:MAG: flagellar hook assembly protein FlgD [Pseudomonadota bacterium]